MKDRLIEWVDEIPGRYWAAYYVVVIVAAFIVLPLAGVTDPLVGAVLFFLIVGPMLLG